MTVHQPSQLFDLDDSALRHDDKDVLRFITCGSVDDGKSSLIGRLLHDTRQIFADQVVALRQQSRRYGTRGAELDLALLVDGLQAEREQGITIDVAYRFFATDRRTFIVADTPGHEQYTRNMATGASTADAAVILVDARSGLTRQTRRHALLVSMLGVRHVALAVNKMDLVDWSQDRFDVIVRDFTAFASALGFVNVRAIPMSAISGENVVTPAAAKWATRGTLLDFLESTPVTGTMDAVPFTMPVQWVNRPSSDFRGFSGLIASGAVAVGDAVVIQPSGLRSTIAGIVTPEGDRRRAVEGQSVTVILADEVDASRGAVLAAPNARLAVIDRVTVRLFWASEKPLMAGDAYLAKIGATTANAVIETIVGRVDPETGALGPANSLATNDIGDAVLSLDREIAIAAYIDNRALGGFVLIDRETTDTSGLGLVVS